MQATNNPDYNMVMKTLLLLRHAKSSWDDPAQDDHDRPLNQRGYMEAPRIGCFILEKGLVPDLIIASTARRAKDTADLVLRACGYPGDLKLEPGLYGAEFRIFTQLIQALPEKAACVLLVGHNPDIEDLIHRLTGEHVAVATATLAQIKLPLENWRDIDQIDSHKNKAELAGLWQAKKLD